MSNRMDDVLVFLEQPATTTATQIKTTQWAAEIGGHDTFIITRITQQDLINTVAGKVNFFGYEKPRLGTLEEHTDVFLLTWLYFTNGKPTARPIVGNFHGGFQHHAEAVSAARDIWRMRERWRADSAA